MLAIVACAVLMMTSVLADGLPTRHLFNETAEQNAERLAWWTHDRFGMFIHFGLYSLPARGEWVKKIETIPEAKYQEYFDTFNPDLFDAKAWAKAAGMEYAVLISLLAEMV